MVANGGKCGVCGDDYTAAHPQPNENTGTYGQGKIVGEYVAGQVIDVTITLTANHLGTFEYRYDKTTIAYLLYNYYGLSIFFF